MKMFEEIKSLRKDFVHDEYTRIVDNWKDYDKISKTKMLETIYKVYSDYNNIIDICTEKELKYLKLILNKDKKYLDKKYQWEESMLIRKFIIEKDFKKDELLVPEEIYDYVVEALSNASLAEAKKKDEINIFAVSYVKIQGSCPIDNVIKIGSLTMNIPEAEIEKHVTNNRVFKYYVYTYDKYVEEVGDYIKTAVYNDYYHLIDDLDHQRRIQTTPPSSAPINYELYKTLFYHNFDINNPIIKKFLDKLDKLPFFGFTAIRPIRESALLNTGRDKLKEAISNVPALKNYNLKDFFELMDKAMDEMPSGALYGLTPAELRNIKKEEKEYENKKRQKYVKQGNAHLSKKESLLFYKIYFALLDFTNQKLKIKPGYRIYGKDKINPYDISEIVEKFWKNKDNIVIEFCLVNPFKFNSDEIKTTQDFRKGIRGMFTIVEYQEEYTAVMNEEKVYMIKGLNCNIDEVISYDDLPCIIITSIIQFKDKLVYDGLFNTYNISFGMGFKKTVAREYEEKIKYYHL